MLENCCVLRLIDINVTIVTGFIRVYIARKGCTLLILSRSVCVCVINHLIDINELKFALFCNEHETAEQASTYLYTSVYISASVSVCGLSTWRFAKCLHIFQG